MASSQSAVRTESPGWRYPPPLDRSFLAAYETAGPGNDSIIRPADILLSTVHNISVLIGRDTSGFGEEKVEVHVGDVMEPEWSGGEKRRLTLDCVICSKGKEEQSVDNACSNYTETAHTSTLYDVTPLQSPKTSYTIPPLSQTFDLPVSTVGICFFYILSLPGGETQYEFSVPFPVMQAARTPHYRFNSSHPTGTADPAIGSAIKASPHTSTRTPSGTGSSSNLQTIVGAVLGVLIGAFLFVAVGWWCWWWLYERRKKRSKKPATDREAQGLDIGGGSRFGEGEELRVRGLSNGVGMETVERAPVVRQVEKDENGEAPPAYHEIVRPGNEAVSTAPAAFIVFR